MDENFTRTRQVKVIKRADIPEKSPDDYVRGHELSLLHLLVKKYEPEVRKILEKRRVVV
jgi:hypothetical protein